MSLSLGKRSLFAILAASGIIEIFHHYAKKTSTLKSDEALEAQKEISAGLEELSAVQESAEAKDNKFDMLSTIKDGHVIVTVSEEYLKGK